MKKLAVFFPGIGYTVDKPLMHYSRRLAADAGFEVLLLPYAGFPQKVKGDPAKMEESYDVALSQSREMLNMARYFLLEKASEPLLQPKSHPIVLYLNAFTSFFIRRLKKPSVSPLEMQSPSPAMPIHG